MMSVSGATGPLGGWAVRAVAALSCRGRVTRSGAGCKAFALSAASVVSAPLPRCPAAPLRAGFFKKSAGVTAMAIISSIAQMVRRSMDQVTRSGNGIEATRMKRVATREPTSGEPAPAESTVAGDRLQRVLRT
jgi:hypothetical protein